MQDILPFAGVMTAIVLVTVASWVLSLWVAGRLWRVAPDHRRKLARAGVPISLALIGVAIAYFTALPSALFAAIAITVLVNGVLLIRRRAESGIPRAAGVFASAAVLVVAVSIPLGYGTCAMAMSPTEAFTSSMAPTVVPGDRFVVDHFALVRRWDIVTFHPGHQPDQTWMRRVVGLPGETLEIDANGGILINGVPTPFPPELAASRYTALPPGGPPCTGCPGSPVHLDADEYFVLGDNSSESIDSRSMPGAPGRHAGAVTRDSLIGVMRGVYAPVDRARWVR